MPATNFNIPPATDISLTGGQQFQFTAVQQCTVCFASVPQFPPPISGKSIQLNQGQVLGPFNAPNVVINCNWNCVLGFQQCNPNSIEGVPKTIHISVSVEKDKKHG